MVEALLTTYDKETMAMFLLAFVIITACFIFIIVITWAIITDIQERREDRRRERKMLYTEQKLEENRIRKKEVGEYEIIEKMSQ